MYVFNMKFSLFFIFAFFLVGALTIPNAFADDVIPSWIKNKFSGTIKNVSTDGQNYFDFNENTLNTLEGKHNYKVTLMD